MANISVVTDNYSVIGDGTLGNELVSTTAVPHYEITTADTSKLLDTHGLYNFFASGCTLSFNTSTVTLVGSRVIVNANNINSDNTYSVAITSDSPPQVFYEGTPNSITQNSSSSVYEYVLKDFNLGYYGSFNQSPIQTLEKNVSQAISIEYVGFYTLVGESATQDINFPNPSNYDGQSLYIWNTGTNPIDSTTTILNVTGFNPKYLGGTSINTLTNKMLNFKSINNDWYLLFTY
jgi:hypothetical protein